MVVVTTLNLLYYFLLVNSTAKFENNFAHVIYQFTNISIQFSSMCLMEKSLNDKAIYTLPNSIILK